MPTLVDGDGFEHQVITSNATATMNPKLWDSLTGTPTFVTGRDGVGKAMRIAASATAVQVTRNLTTAGTMLVVSFYFKCSAAPTGATLRIFRATADGVGLIGIKTDGNLTATYATGTGIVTPTGVAVCDGLWHRVDARFNSSPATHTVEWSVDGVAQTNGSSGLVAASNFTSWSIGTNIATSTGTADIDDVAISATSGDHPLGDHICFSVVPTTDNAASVYGTNVMEQGDGTDLSSSNQGAQYLDEWAPTTGTNNADSVTQAATGTGNFVDVEFANAPSYASSTLWGVVGIVAHQSDGTTANNGTSRIVDSSATTLTDIYSGDMSETSAHYTRRVITAPAGGWSVSNFNGCRGRVGLSSNSATDPEWLALMLTAITPDGIPGSATPAVVAGVGTVPAPTATGSAGATASPAVVAGIGAVPAPTATGGTATNKPRRMLLRGTGGPR